MLAPPTAISAAVDGLFWAAAASILWAPLAVSWRAHLIRRRRRVRAIACTLAFAVLGLIVRVLLPNVAAVGPGLALLIWEMSFAATSVFLVLASDLRMKKRHSAGHWDVATSPEAGWHRTRWRLAPLVVCSAAAVIVGFGYNMAAVAGQSQAAQVIAED